MAFNNIEEQDHSSESHEQKINLQQSDENSESISDKPKDVP